MLSDSDIMHDVQQGQGERFAELVLRYRPRLLKAALSKVGTSIIAEDLVQETFLAAYTSRQTYDATFKFSTWIWTIFLNTCRRVGRKRSREREVLQQAADTGSLRSEAIISQGLTALLVSERHEVLHQLLDRIPEVEGDALRLRFFGQLPFEEIATAMNSSISGAKVRVKRGLFRLAELCREENHEL